jgi:hypothetical protein
LSQVTLVAVPFPHCDIMADCQCHISVLPLIFEDVLTERDDKLAPQFG